MLEDDYALFILYDRRESLNLEGEKTCCARNADANFNVPHPKRPEASLLLHVVIRGACCQKRCSAAAICLAHCYQPRLAVCEAVGVTVRIRWSVQAVTL